MDNAENRSTLEFLLHENTLPGFNDSGAHITNMAFFDSNLMSLKLAREQGEDVVAKVVKRLTKDPADTFGLDAGSLTIGARADMVLINPEALDGWEPDQTRKLVYRDIFEHEQMVNRPEGIVDSVYISGEMAWDGDKGATEALGNKPLGSYLTSGSIALSSAEVSEAALFTACRASPRLGRYFNASSVLNLRPAFPHLLDCVYVDVTQS